MADDDQQENQQDNQDEYQFADRVTLKDLHTIAQGCREVLC